MSDPNEPDLLSPPEDGDFIQGLYQRVPMATYVADPCREPSLNSSTLKVLTKRTPLHAWLQHPRLGDQGDWSRRADIGSAVHAYSLEGGGGVEVIEADNYRTKAARDRRDEIVSKGLIPILEKDWRHVKAAGDRVLSYLIQHFPLAIEATGIWNDNGTWCRIRPDYLTRSTVINVKTAVNADPRSWQRRICWPDQLDLTAAWYRRGLKRITGQDWGYVILVQEIEPPYGQSIHDPLDSEASEMLNRVFEHYILVWQECLETGVWPDYPEGVEYPEWPAWRSLELMERLTKERA